jgi:putative transposase
LEGPDDEAIEVHGSADHRGVREQEAGAKTADLCRRHGISSATFYAWKAKYGGLDVSEARRLKALEDENAKLKKLLADAMLDNVALKDLLAKKF